MISKFILCVLVIFSTQQLDNGLGLTPQMGWNSWNHFGCGINEALIKKTADQLVATGLAAKGYKYVNLDDCWQVMTYLFRLLGIKLQNKLFKTKIISQAE